MNFGRSVPGRDYADSFPPAHLPQAARCTSHFCPSCHQNRIVLQGELVKDKVLAPDRALWLDFSRPVERAKHLRNPDLPV